MIASTMARKRRVAFGLIQSRLFVCVCMDRGEERRVFHFAKRTAEKIKRYGEDLA